MGHSQSKEYIAWGPTKEVALENLKNKLRRDFPKAFIYDDHGVLKVSTTRTIKKITRTRSVWPLHSHCLKVKFRKTD